MWLAMCSLVSVCLSVCTTHAVTYESLDLETSLLVHRYIFRISRKSSYFKAIRGVAKGSGGVMGCQNTSLCWGLVWFFTPHNIKHAFQKTQNDCHQWLSGSSIACIKFVLCRPGPCWVSLQHSSRSLVDLMGPCFKGEVRRGQDETG